MLGDHVGSNVWVSPHNLPLLLGEWPRLVEDVVPDADLAEVMKRTRRSKEFAFTIAQVEMVA